MSTVTAGVAGDRAGGRPILIRGQRPATMRSSGPAPGRPRSRRGEMRPTTAILLFVSLTTLAPSALAQRPRPVMIAAAIEAPQALPPAKVPEPQFVSAGIELSGPTPTAERVLHGEDGEAVAPPADTPDDPAVGEEIDKESQEMEEMRQAEEASHPEDGKAAPHAPGEGRIALIPELDHDLAQLQAEYDIPIDVNEAVVGYIRFFQSRAAR